MPLYEIVPKLNDGGPINHRKFVKRYRLCSKGLNPKRIRILRDTTMEKITSILDLSITKMVTIMYSMRIMRLSQNLGFVDDYHPEDLCSYFQNNFFGHGQRKCHGVERHKMNWAMLLDGQIRRNNIKKVQSLNW